MWPRTHFSFPLGVPITATHRGPDGRKASATALLHGGHLGTVLAVVDPVERTALVGAGEGKLITAVVGDRRVFRELGGATDGLPVVVRLGLPLPPVQATPAGLAGTDPRLQGRGSPGSVVVEGEQNALEAEPVRHRPGAREIAPATAAATARPEPATHRPRSTVECPHPHERPNRHTGSGLPGRFSEIVLRLRGRSVPHGQGPVEYQVRAVLMGESASRGLSRPRARQPSRSARVPAPASISLSVLQRGVGQPVWPGRRSSARLGGSATPAPELGIRGTSREARFARTENAFDRVVLSGRERGPGCLGSWSERSAGVVDPAVG